MVFADKLISFLVYEEINGRRENQEDSSEDMHIFYDLICQLVTPWETI